MQDHIRRDAALVRHALAQLPQPFEQLEIRGRCLARPTRRLTIFGGSAISTASPLKSTR